jgi:hypothetical protein
MTGTCPGVLSAGETSRSCRCAPPYNPLSDLSDDFSDEMGFSEDGDWHRRLDKGRRDTAGEGMSRKDRLRVDSGEVSLDRDSDPVSLFMACEPGKGGGEGREAERTRPSICTITWGFVSKGRAFLAVESWGGVDVRRCEGKDGGKNN